MIDIKDVTKVYEGKSGSALALDSVRLHIEAGEFFVLLGPSGSGKTTLLRSVAGLEKPNHGEIRLNSRLVYSSDKDIFVTPDQRDLGMVFQSYAIWPHMTVFENVALPLKEGRTKLAPELVEGRVANALEMVGLSGLGERPAPLLSGGQQQRVALARALAVRPKVMLMDEPLSNLDARLREEVRREIKSLTRRMNVTTLYVTHDQAEAMELADRIAIMDRGRILQVGTPEDLYQRPEHPKVAQFLGSANWFYGSLLTRDTVSTIFGELVVDPEQTGGVVKGEKITLAIRPECIRVVAVGSTLSTEESVLSGQIASCAYFGDHRVYTVRIGHEELLVKTSFDQQLSGAVQVVIPRRHLHMFWNKGD